MAVRPMQSRQKLSSRQQEVLKFFNESAANDGVPPTVRDVMGSFDLSPRGAHLQLLKLAELGLIEHRPGRKPAFRPKYIRTGSSVSILGRVPAGPPSEQAEDYRGSVQVPWRVGARSFALYVHGDSMEDAHILDGDLVVVDPEPCPRDGDVVIAMIDGEQTVKHFFATGTSWVLRAANAKYPGDIRPRLGGDRVVGRVEAVLRGMSSGRVRG